MEGRTSAFRTGTACCVLEPATLPALPPAFRLRKICWNEQIVSNVVFYFKGQRASGDMDRVDRHLPLPDGHGTVDVHGGWYDATGNYGIHLSRPNAYFFFNPQQVPAARGRCSPAITASTRGTMIIQRVRATSWTRALRRGFLVRLKRSNGSFFQSIDAPGPQKLAKDRKVSDPNWRTQIKMNASDTTERAAPVATSPHMYEASYRAGGGMSIAALALASTMPQDGDFTRAQYFETAEETLRSSKRTIC